MDFRQRIAAWLAGQTGMSEEEMNGWMEVPPQPQLGDYAFPCFRLARVMRQAPPKIAADLAERAKSELDWLERIDAVNGYLNFFLDRGAYSRQVLSRLFEDRRPLGTSEEGQGQTVIIEYSSPNIAKPFHVGHAFTTILGHALSRIYDRLGYRTVRMNHLGDYGTQFGKLIVAYRLWGDQAALQANPIPELLRIYVKFHEEAKDQPELEQDAREAFRRLEAGNDEETALWQSFRDLSLLSFDRVYRRLGVTFDFNYGESFYSDQIDDVVTLLRDKNLIEESDGAQVVKLDEYDLPPCIIVKSDGTTIYASRDLAAVLFRDKTWHFDRNIYVVGLPQALHFRQVFSVLKKAGVEAADHCVHVGFGLVKFADRKLSTRSGDVIFLEDLLNESVEKTLEIIRKNDELRQGDMNEADMRQIAEKIGIGAILYTFMKNGRERDIVFSWDEMLDFEGDSAPYVQYTYARARSILRKADQVEAPSVFPDALASCLTGDDEFAILKLVDGFSDAVRRAAEAYEPYLVIRQVTAVARAFNKYYNQTPILRTEQADLREARLLLVQVVCRTIREGLELVGIDVVERM